MVAVERFPPSHPVSSGVVQGPFETGRILYIITQLGIVGQRERETRIHMGSAHGQFVKRAPGFPGPPKFQLGGIFNRD